MDWSEETEALFFQAFLSRDNAYKPTGINKHFHMLIVYHRFVKSMNKAVDIELLWSKLEDLYDLDQLDRLDTFPFPNEEVEFKLPEKIKFIQESSDDEEKKRTKSPSKKKRRL